MDMRYIQKSMWKGVENSLLGALINSQSPTIIIVKNYKTKNPLTSEEKKCLNSQSVSNKISPLELFHIQSFLDFLLASCYYRGNLNYLDPSTVKVSGLKHLDH